MTYQICAKHLLPMQPIKTDGDVLTGYICMGCIDPYSGGFIVHEAPRP